MDLSKIVKPTLILDEEKCRRNIKRMAEKARLSGVIFRPHFKTHQSAEIGTWFTDEGVKCITVSSVTMAKYFAGCGWNDITIAFPVNLRELKEIEELSRSINLNILVSDYTQIEYLRLNKKLTIGCYIEVDTGYKRSGVEWDNEVLIKRIQEDLQLNHSIRINGFLTHSGQTYVAKSPMEIIDIYHDTLMKMSKLRQLSDQNVLLSTGDTPSCSLIANYKGWDEIRPGNFVFYDLTQHMLGACDFDNIAIVAACPVVEKNIKRRELIIYGGGVHLSKDSLKLKDRQIVFGKAVYLESRSWKPMSEGDFLRSLSQEHGIISASDDLFNSVKAGDLIGVIPVHSCMTADLLRQYHTFEDSTISCFSPK
jgi:D-serine deaminase-like pyridoxal phosphate-dependent protein